MFFIDKKLEKRAEELKEYRYRDIIHLEHLESLEDNSGLINPPLPAEDNDWKKMYVGENWKGRNRYLWLRKEIKIPAEWLGKKVVGIFDFGNTGGGNNLGFESLLYLDGHPYQGVDLNHKEVFLPVNENKMEFASIFRLWSGLEGGGIPTDQEHKIQKADIGWLDEETDDLYYWTIMILDTIKQLPEGDTTIFDLRDGLNKAYLMIDWSEPGSGSFYASVHDADEYLVERIKGMDKHSSVNVFCTGHTHIDVAWLWQLKHTREKCARSFSTVLRLMELYPEYIFLQTQPQLYEYIKEDFPDIYDQMKERIKEGRWEADGGMWVEADCNIISGESLTRQILIGSKFIKDEFDHDVEYLWLPDVFGYSWALPQILKKSGIDMFMTTKISWNQYNRMPHDTFYWTGIDGSQVLAHFITTPDPWSEPGSWFYTYNGQLTPKTVKGVWEAYQDKEINRDLLISYGYGDGGGGVNRDALEQRRRIDKIPGLPNLTTKRAGSYFEDLKENIRKAENYVHVWDGELYLEYHRGTYTSHAYNKKMNRKMELLYRRAEWYTAMAALSQGKLESADQEKLTKGWKIILTNQFHDIIPGSSIKEVYDDSKKDYEKAEELVGEVIKDSLNCIAKENTKSAVIINDSLWERDELILLEDAHDLIIKDEDGNLLRTQQGEKGLIVEAVNVPSMGCKKIYLEPGSATKEEDSVFTINNNEIETPYYLIKLNAEGQITSLYHKEKNRELIPKGERANVFQVFEDKPLAHDAWDIDIYYQEKMTEITQLKKMSVVECGSLRAVVRFNYTYGNSKIEQDIILYAYSPRIDFHTHVDYHEKRQLLKVAFPMDIRAVSATYDIQYGNVKRPTHWNTSWDQAKFETAAHKWVDLSEGDFGVSLLNDCKYGHDIKGKVIRLTLIKTALHPDYLQDQGEHEFTYSLLPHQGCFVKGNTVREAFSLNQPLHLVKGEITLPWKQFIKSSSDLIELDAVKKSEDGKYLVIRFHEYTGSRQEIVLTPGFSYKGWMEGDLRERPINEEKTTKEISLTVNPYEIKTLMFRF